MVNGGLRFGSRRRFPLTMWMDDDDDDDDARLVLDVTASFVWDVASPLLSGHAVTIVGNNGSVVVVVVVVVVCVVLNSGVDSVTTSTLLLLL